ncbi:MAG: TM0996/MTH895 family glutaredoxin-like protein [Bacteroidales bacterium]|nr:TM0996/MTH895 family glutaredoxin-like protein [Bacteroidales bacterium]
MEIKVLGPGCPKCKKMMESTKLAVELLGIEASITKVDDINDILKYNVLTTPALVVNEKVVHSGRIAGKKEIAQLISPFLENKNQEI